MSSVVSPVAARSKAAPHRWRLPADDVVNLGDFGTTEVDPERAEEASVPVRIVADFLASIMKSQAHRLLGETDGDRR